MRGPKKSETLEIRLPYAAKQTFMARCRAEGRTASEALRAFIDGGQEPPRRRWPRLRWAAAAVAALGIGAIAAPSLARTTLPAQFARLDADHDGKLSLQEFEQGAAVQVSAGPAAVRLVPAPDGQGLVRREFGRIDANRDGEIALDEFRRYYAR